MLQLLLVCLRKFILRKNQFESAVLSASSLPISYDVLCDAYSSRLGMTAWFIDPLAQSFGQLLVGRRTSFAQFKLIHNKVCARKSVASV